MTEKDVFFVVDYGNYNDLNNLRVKDLRDIVNRVSFYTSDEEVEVDEIKTMSKPKCIAYIMSKCTDNPIWYGNGVRLKKDSKEYVRMVEKYTDKYVYEMEYQTLYFTSEEAMSRYFGYGFDEYEMMEVNLDYTDVIEKYEDWMGSFGLEGFIHNNVKVIIDKEKEDEIEVVDENVVGDQVMLFLNVAYNDVEGIVEKLMTKDRKVVDGGRENLKEYLRGVVEDYLENIDEHFREWE